MKNRVSPIFSFDSHKESVTLINPRFNRIRIDKKINDYDVRTSQIPELG